MASVEIVNNSDWEDNQNNIDNSTADAIKEDDLQQEVNTLEDCERIGKLKKEAKERKEALKEKFPDTPKKVKEKSIESQNFEDYIDFEDYVAGNLLIVKELKQEHLLKNTCYMPVTFKTVLQTLSSELILRNNISLKSYELQDLLLSYGATKLLNNELKSFGLITKLYVRNLINDEIMLPVAIRDTHEIISDKYSKVGFTFRVSPYTEGLLSKASVTLNVNNNTILIICLLLTFEDVTIFENKVTWIKDFFLIREKAGLKILKEISLTLLKELRDHYLLIRSSSYDPNLDKDKLDRLKNIIKLMDESRFYHPNI